MTSTNIQMQYLQYLQLQLQLTFQREKKTLTFLAISRLTSFAIMITNLTIFQPLLQV